MENREHEICPYFEVCGQCCKLYGTRQGDYQRQAYCLTRENWLRCANYKAHTRRRLNMSDPRELRNIRLVGELNELEELQRINSSLFPRNFCVFDLKKETRCRFLILDQDAQTIDEMNTAMSTEITNNSTVEQTTAAEAELARLQELQVSKESDESIIFVPEDDVDQILTLQQSLSVNELKRRADKCGMILEIIDDSPEALKNILSEIENREDAIRRYMRVSQ